MDDQAAARQMTEYLLSLGHRRIAFVQGHDEHIASLQRLAGYRAALRAWSVPELPHLLVQGDFTFEGGQRAASALLDTMEAAPTAIFASNDEMAAGCLAEAHRRRLRVPQELSVAGFDDTWIATMLYPPLTTIRQPIREMGHAATGQLLALIEGLKPPHEVRFAHRLVERQSAGTHQVRP
jgi:LacI family transcriptional regulator